MQDFGDVEQLKALFAKFASPVRLKVRYDDSDLGQGIHSFMEFWVKWSLGSQFSSRSSSQVLPLRTKVREHPMPPEGLHSISTRRRALP